MHETACICPRAAAAPRPELHGATDAEWFRRATGANHGTQHGSPNRFGIECYHVNARFSKSLEDIGELRTSKVSLILFYCLQAIWCRFRYGVENFYYVPAPGKPVALYRDWLVMFICRPFFKRIILHWHAAGLAKWLETSVQIRTRAVTYHACSKNADLSIVISNYNVADAEKLLSRRIRRGERRHSRSVPGF